MTVTTEAETIMEYSFMYVYNISLSPPQGVYAPHDKNTYISSTPVLFHFQLWLALGACVPLGSQSCVFPRVLRGCCSVQSYLNPSVFPKKFICNIQLKCSNHCMLVRGGGEKEKDFLLSFFMTEISALTWCQPLGDDLL